MDCDETHDEVLNKMRVEPDWPKWVLGGDRCNLALNIACGYGKEAETLRRVTGAEVVGVDLNTSLFKSHDLFADNPYLQLVNASVFALPFKERTFDLVHSEGTLHHTYSTKQAFFNLIK